MRKLGFTLAEVLITLVIIGVIAAMTVPTLLNSTASQEYKTGLKKMHSLMSQALTMHTAITGEDGSTISTDSNKYNAFITNRFALLNTVSGSANFTQPYTLADGMMIVSAATGSDSCSDTTPCLTITIDTNGTKAPNALTDASVNASSRNSSLKDQYELEIYPHMVKGKNAAAYILNNTQFQN